MDEIFDKMQKEIEEKSIQCARLDGYIAGLKKAMAEFDILRDPIKDDIKKIKTKKKCR